MKATNEAVNSNVVATINNVAIVIVKKEKEELVPIKPICEALGIDMQSQRKKIKEDDILSSVVVIRKATGADGKSYKMVCLPLEYVFGWLFTINHKNVKPEAQEAVKKYKMEHYHALQRHLTEYKEYVTEQQQRVDDEYPKEYAIRQELSNIKKRLEEQKAQWKKLRAMTFNEWKANKSSNKQ